MKALKTVIIPCEKVLFPLCAGTSAFTIRKLFSTGFSRPVETASRHAECNLPVLIFSSSFRAAFFSPPGADLPSFGRRRQPPQKTHKKCVSHNYTRACEARRKMPAISSPSSSVFPMRSRAFSSQCRAVLSGTPKRTDILPQLYP